MIAVRHLWNVPGVIAEAIRHAGRLIQLAISEEFQALGLACGTATPLVERFLPDTQSLACAGNLLSPSKNAYSEVGRVHDNLVHQLGLLEVGRLWYPLTQAQQRSYMCNYIKHMGSHTLQQLRVYSFDEIKVLFEATVKRVNTFTPMESDDRVPKVIAGSSNRSAEEELGEESSKRQKIGEESEPAEESIDKESDELSQEQLQHLIIIVPKEGMNVDVAN
ncbi:hypothetical protein Tco_0012228 [Tanacetum coccineum]